MISLADLWPPFGLAVTAGELTLTPVTDDDLPGLVELVLSGVHPSETMPFNVPWTRTPPADLPREFARYHWQVRAETTPEKCDVVLAVRHRGELVGAQGFHTMHFAVTRTAETGSWLARRHQGQGIGTAMRQAICALLFDHLGATEVTSGAFIDNPASLAVSRKVGYRSNGQGRVYRDGEVATQQLSVLTPERFVRGETPVVVSGVEPLRNYLGVATPSATPGASSDGASPEWISP